MGAFVGTCEGAFVGTVVRAFVGTIVGALVGTFVGAFVGTFVGVFVGTSNYTVLILHPCSSHTAPILILIHNLHMHLKYHVSTTWWHRTNMLPPTDELFEVRAARRPHKIPA